MIKYNELADIFKENNINYFSGVPDSTFKGWIKFLEDNPERFTNRIAVNECEAIANCAGYYLSTGKIGVVYLQNSGLGKTINPLTSLTSKEVYAIPNILMIGWRGDPNNLNGDEPQHKMMGRIMINQLKTLEIPYRVLSDNLDNLREVIKWAKENSKENNYSTAIIIKKGIFEDYTTLVQDKEIYDMKREEAIKIIIDNISKDSAVISTTGKTSRELFEYRIFKNEGLKDFLTVGSMGCSASIANEIALQKPNKKIYCFDGDGAILMQMGALASIGYNKAKNLTHIIFDNESYDSTGGQPTISKNIKFEIIAKDCGYNNSFSIKTKKDLIDLISKIEDMEGPNMIVIKINKGSRKDLKRPTTTPIENKNKFMEFLK